MININKLEDLKFIFDAIPYEITIKDIEGNYKLANEKFLSNTDFITSILKKSTEDFWDEDDYKFLKELENQLLTTRKKICCEHKLRSFKKEKWYKIYKSIVNIDGTPYILSIYNEITFDRNINDLMFYHLERESYDILGYYDMTRNIEEDVSIFNINYKERIEILCMNLAEILKVNFIDIYLYDNTKKILYIYICTEKNSKRIKKINLQTSMKERDIIAKLYEENSCVKAYNISYGNKIIGMMNIPHGNGKEIDQEMIDLIRSTCYKFGILFENRIISKRLEKEISKKKLYKDALDLEISKTEFFANMSHEFRTPLNIINTSVQLLNSILDNKDFYLHKDKLQKNINHIQQNIYRLIRMVNNILDINKIDYNRDVLNLKNYNIVSIIEEIVSSVVDYTKNLKKTIIFDTEVEEIFLACDADKIEKIMLNILSNAIKYGSDEGTIIIKVSFAENKSNVLISVWNEGSSISEKESKIVFDKFVRLNNLLNRPCEGSGMGLFLVKSLVNLHKGEVWINTNVKDGFEIDFTLPIYLTNDKHRHSNIKTASSNKIELCNIEFSDIYSI